MKSVKQSLVALTLTFVLTVSALAGDTPCGVIGGNPPSDPKGRASANVSIDSDFEVVLLISVLKSIFSL